jgi:hypothetical protein
MSDGRAVRRRTTDSGSNSSTLSHTSSSVGLQHPQEVRLQQTNATAELGYRVHNHTLAPATAPHDPTVATGAEVAIRDKIVTQPPEQRPQSYCAGDVSVKHPAQAGSGPGAAHHPGRHEAAALPALPVVASSMALNRQRTVSESGACSTALRPCDGKMPAHRVTFQV